MKFKPTLGLTRVKQSDTQSKAAEYNVGPGGTEMNEMVDDMIEQLRAVSTNLRQALQAPQHVENAHLGGAVVRPTASRGGSSGSWLPPTLRKSNGATQLALKRRGAAAAM